MLNLKAWMTKVTQWFASGCNIQLLGRANPPAGNAYGAILRIRGNADYNAANTQDTYWLGVDSYGGFHTGLQLNQADKISWKHVGSFTVRNYGAMTVYRFGHMRTMVVNVWPSSGTLIGTIDAIDIPPSFVKAPGFVYNGSDYVTCTIVIDTSGNVRGQDLWGGAIAGASAGYLSPQNFTYMVDKTQDTTV